MSVWLTTFSFPCNVIIIIYSTYLIERFFSIVLKTKNYYTLTLFWHLTLTLSYYSQSLRLLKEFIVSIILFEHRSSHDIEYCNWLKLRLGGNLNSFLKHCFTQSVAEKLLTNHILLTDRAWSCKKIFIESRNELAD